MAQRSHVPKFGNWESEENVPYTAYFDKASKSRSGAKMINPNDPQENVFSDDKPSVRATAIKTGAEPEAAVIPGAARSKHERRSSREDGDLSRSTDSPARYDNVVRKTATDSPLHRYADSKRTGRQSGGSSVEQSPIHSHHHARVSGKGSGVSSPSSERKGSFEHNHGLASATPVRSRLRTTTRADETLDKGAAVPKFGDWNEDPSSADGYTHIFNKVREEKQGGSERVPVMPTQSSYNGHHQNKNNDSTAFCCFAWGRK
ncbi:RPM1-interacting protein 4-like isoform X2 [Macadamia integrifolia]|uniref:RPM1-interacting protein 4-like isoform X2 n=1 Tax=Macadamia integrifolia TaxID=60698 RepID=UPI001C4F7ED9|nr:RPM1-interacting protein 4-like isoform X2 [Macadamia integrifolia]